VIPVLGFLYISRSDLFVDAVTSINHPIDSMVVVDNSNDGTCPQVDGARYLKMHRNMGVAWGWNTIIKNTREAPYWIIANSDIKFGPDDLKRMEAKMQSGVELLLNDSMALFGISATCIQKVGWFDENFVPAYCEDNDYLRRAKLLGGVHIEWITPSFSHFGSATIKSDEARRDGNNRSYPQNVKYYQDKHGGIMGQETYDTPFNQSGSWRECPTLDFDRLRALSWD